MEVQLLQRELAYVGVIGSRSKIAVVSQRLRELGISEEAIASVHTPIGTRYPCGNAGGDCCQHCR